jgi:hypothetical protein
VCAARSVIKTDTFDDIACMAWDVMCCAARRGECSRSAYGWPHGSAIIIQRTSMEKCATQTSNNQTGALSARTKALCGTTPSRFTVSSGGRFDTMPSGPILQTWRNTTGGPLIFVDVRGGIGIRVGLGIARRRHGNRRDHGEPA